MALYFNVKGEASKVLIPPVSSAKVSKISLVNIQKVSKCKVDLYVEGKFDKFYILKDLELPRGATITHDFNFNNVNTDKGLYIKLTDGATFTLTGAIDVTGTNANVPGDGNTLFLSELSVGDEVVVSGETRTIATITANNAATVTANWGSDLANDTTPDCNPTALVDVILN